VRCCEDELKAGDDPVKKVPIINFDDASFSSGIAMPIYF
jgi:hypothetical protein